MLDLASDDLASEAARRTGEANGGLTRLEKSRISEPLRTLLEPYFDAVKRCREVHGPHAYPGSAAISQDMTREQDRLLLVEKHPTDASVLTVAMAGDRRVKVLLQDGWTALRRSAAAGTPGARADRPAFRGARRIQPDGKGSGQGMAEMADRYLCAVVPH
jgi:23S rRNA A2030 N6-methylase RlmJ